MTKFNVNVIESLKRILEFNTKHYRIDFLQDVKQLVEASMSDKEEEKLFFWLSRESGTLLISARDAFVNTSSRTSFLYYQDTPNVIAYAIRINRKAGPDVFGDIVRMQYYDFCRYTLEKMCWISQQVQVEYTNGETEIYRMEEFSKYFGRLSKGRSIKDKNHLLAQEEEEEVWKFISSTMDSFFSPQYNISKKMDRYILSTDDAGMPVIQFRVEGDIISEKEYLFRALKYAASEFSTTLEGQQCIKEHGEITITDIWYHCPNSYLRKYGLEKECGTIYQLEPDLEGAYNN